MVQPVVFDEKNQGSNIAQQMSSSNSDVTQGTAGPVVEAVTIIDLLHATPSTTNTYIIKTDIEGLDCKVEPT